MIPIGVGRGLAGLAERVGELGLDGFAQLSLFAVPAGSFQVLAF